MKHKTALISFVAFILAGVLSTVAFVPFSTPSYEGSDKWMSTLKDDTPINKLSIPGTHDSGATHSIFDVAGMCQTTSIDKQLSMGVRFFDMRLQDVNGSFKIVHDFVDQNLTFASVLDSFVGFLEKNPSEFLLVSIKEEKSSVNSSWDFESLLLDYFANYSSDVIDTSTSLPNTLKEARGKMYVLSRYYGSTIGVPCSSGWYDNDSFEMNNMYVQDHYCIDNVKEKIDDIKSTLEKTNQSNYDLVLNFTSCYLDNAFPPSYAVTPAKTINPFLVDYLSSFMGSTGVLVMDFVNNELTTQVVERNAEYVK